MPTLEQHQQAFHNAKLAGDDDAAASIMQDIMQAEKAAALKRAAEEGGPVTRGLANLGAGYDAAWQGLKQITPGLKSPSDADIRDKRTRDDALAKATETGAGSDWMPSIGRTLQFAGEVAPTLAIPGVGAAGNLAAKALPRAASAATRALVRATGTGAAGGAAAGALQPTTDDESRTANVVLGAAGGTVLPAAGVAWRAAKRGLGTLTQAGGRARAGTVLREALGAGADDVADSAVLRTLQRDSEPASVRQVPESLSEATGNVNAARLESAARRAPETAASWDDFVREQNATRFNAVQDATREAPRLDARVAQRNAVTGPLRDDALNSAKQDQWFHTPAADAAERIAAGPTSANPAVAKVADYVRNQIGENAKTAITPERLYEVRKVLADKLHGPHVIGDELSAAVKGADRETLALINSIDSALNDASGGKWQGYLDKYQQRSSPVNASRAARDARNVFADPNIPEVGGAPEVTLNRLRSARNAGQSNFDPRVSDFSGKAQNTLDALSDQYTRAQEPAKVRKLVGSQGGGSQTSTDLDAALARLVKPGGNGVIAAAAEALTSRSNLGLRSELSRLLQNPTAAASAIRQAAKLGQPISPAQQMLLEAVARSAATGATGLLSGP